MDLFSESEPLTSRRTCCKHKLCGGVCNFQNPHLWRVLSASQFLRKRLKELRKAAGLTQEEYAELAGIPYKVYQHIEAGRRSNPRLSTLEKLAQGFGLTVNALFAVQAPELRLTKQRLKKLSAKA